ncbi:hypothetical protein QUB68_10030 [Microcoleus sp. A006_D1]|uniref:hypothetical protein n=1 Tax=Microcoleus sp. A006_D1 TaxID=3055267 RepID=UPI002FD216C5
MSNLNSTRWENPIALALSAKDFVSKSMLNDRSFCGTYGALLSTFYHDIPGDRVFSENLKNLSTDFSALLYYFSGAGRELRNWDSGRSVNIRAWIEGSRARMGDRLRDLRSKRSRLGWRQKSADCLAFK